MPDPHWENLKDIFHAAAVLPLNERAAYLDQACDGNQSVRAAVESLLKSHEESNFVDQPAHQAAAEILIEDRKLSPSDLIGHYRIVSLLGEGGMGRVYLAEDTKLGRKVGLKILPVELAADQERMRRFTQEAKTAASLNHQNIAQVFEIGEHNHTRYIAMEYVDGETLRELLSRRKLEIKRAVEFAAQVASGLAAAHKAGVVHRDIKPENLILAASGQIKILDFGLAKLADPAGSVGEIAADAEAPTQVKTRSGVVMGTVSYMSPEQARAEKLDQRTDIFSLGVVVYEMLTGKRPFQGKSAIDTLHAIINQEPPPVTHLNSFVPPELADILGKALAKETSERYQHAGDFELDLRRFKRALESNSLISVRRDGLGFPTHKKRFSLATIIVAACLLFGVAAAAWMIGQATARTDRSSIALKNVTQTQLTSDPGYEGEPTFSPDGETIAYVSDRTGDSEIFLKQISGGPDINITNNTADDVQPAFSPDGKQIAFVSSRAGGSGLRYEGYDLPPMGGDIWVMPALGGMARRIAERGNFPSWSPDGLAILFTAGPAFAQKIYRVPASGGVPQEIVPKLEGVPRFLLYPSYSADGKWILFEADGSAVFGGPRSIYVMKAEGGDLQRIATGQRPAWNADSTSVVYSSAEPGKNFSLWQVGFDLVQGKLSAPAEPLTVSRGRDTQAAVSRDGKLIAFSGLELSFNVETLMFDAETGRSTGTPESLTSGQRISYFQSFSQDGKSIVFESREAVASQIWRLDRGAKPVQLTSGSNAENSFPRWSPDGRSIAFHHRSTQESTSVTNISVMAVDGANPHVLIENAGLFAWMPDSRALVYFSRPDRQIYFFDMANGHSRRLTNETGIVQLFATSPDGQWVVYQTLASGNIDLRAIRIEGGEAQTIVATPHQDYHPIVSPSGKWLYFQLDHKNLYRVPGPAQNWRKAEPEKVTNFHESGLFLEDPQISGDGRQLLYSRGRITGDIWIMNLGN